MNPAPGANRDNFYAQQFNTCGSAAACQFISGLYSIKYLLAQKISKDAQRYFYDNLVSSLYNINKFPMLVEVNNRLLL